MFIPDLARSQVGKYVATAVAKDMSELSSDKEKIEENREAQTVKD